MKYGHPTEVVNTFVQNIINLRIQPSVPRNCYTENHCRKKSGHDFIVIHLNIKLQAAKNVSAKNCDKSFQKCFNCTSSRQEASDCTSKTNCRNCGKKHHTSICIKEKPSSQPMCAVTEHKVIYSAVMVSINGTHCRSLPDSLARSFYALKTFTDYLQLKPVRTIFKDIEMISHLNKDGRQPYLV